MKKPPVPKYITITDPEGATLGYGGPFVPVTHRCVFIGEECFGLDNFCKLFDYRSDTKMLIMKELGWGDYESGSFDRFTWERK